MVFSFQIFAVFTFSVAFLSVQGKHTKNDEGNDEGQDFELTMLLFLQINMLTLKKFEYSEQDRLSFILFFLFQTAHKLRVP